LRKELMACTAFRFYVAFVNQEGVATLMQALEEARMKGVRGKVLVSQYLNFTDPVALRSLLRFDNVLVRIATQGSVHAKGYFFDHDGIERYLIGSSNWTASALATNTELNIFLQALPQDTIAQAIAEEFDTQFHRALPVTEEFLAAYEQIYNARRETASRDRLRPDEATALDPVLQPNAMQREALAALARLRADAKHKALVISATGTGKTFLSAFDVQAMNARRMLFVVHRKTIANAAMQSFQRIFGGSRTYGLYTGATKDLDADFVFSTVLTLSRPEHLQKFQPDAFDYVVVDESHRAGAASYARFLNHFAPRFLLGMTATPERTDGGDIFQYFDHTIAYEIRLHQALEEDILCPFHYFGVTDITVDGNALEDETSFSRLASAERVDQIIQKARLYGCDDGIVRGLIFCSRVDEARQISDELNRRGFRTVALDGGSDDELREECIRRLEATADSRDKLDYILTVDIFNEGVDIPQCNQIILLRPTDSAIVFVQQLGRGLRRVANKDKYLTVIDFIGNYTNNYLIPIALYGDRSYDKDRLRQLLVNGDESIPGTSSISFDEIARERIFASINSANVDLVRELRGEFDSLQRRLGRVPMMVDFVEHDCRDPMCFARQSGSFYAFSRTYQPNDVANVGDAGAKVLETYSRDSFDGRSLEEPLLLSALLAAEEIAEDLLDERFREAVGCTPPSGRWMAALRSLNMTFLRERMRGQMVPVAEVAGLKLFEIYDRSFRRLPDFDVLVSDPTFRAYVTDLANYAAGRFLESFDAANYVDGFVRLRKYRRSDVFRILGAKENPVAQNVGGYLIAPDKSWCPLFVTYHKQAGISATTQYEDAFLDRKTMQYFTKSNRSFSSPDVDFFRNARAPQRILLFVKKNDDEGKDFYYLGDVSPVPESFREQMMQDNRTPVVTMRLALKEAVPEGLYEYITR
jgi:superfamily II DNA or RNA helicase/HKD family nuclease